MRAGHSPKRVQHYDGCAMLQPPDLIYVSYSTYATIDLCGQIFLGAGRTWTSLEAGRLPAFLDVDGRGDMVAMMSQAMIYVHR